MKDTANKSMGAKDPSDAAQNPHTQPAGSGQSQSQSSQAAQPKNSQSGQQSSPTPRGAAGGQGQQSQRGGLARRDRFTPSLWTESPFAVLRRFSEEMDRMFEDFGMGRGGLMSRLGLQGAGGQSMWSPQVEVSQKNNQLVICADLPGLKKDDINVEFGDDSLTIHGERRQESEDEQEGYRRSERSYGSFSRTVALPEGVNPEDATATFQDGVLKITVPLPQPQEPQRRRIEIQGAEKSQAQGQSAAPGKSSSPPSSSTESRA